MNGDSWVWFPVRIQIYLFEMTPISSLRCTGPLTQWVQDTVSPKQDDWIVKLITHHHLVSKTRIRRASLLRLSQTFTAGYLVIAELYFFPKLLSTA
jgi:hypothetical protein